MERPPAAVPFWFLPPPPTLSARGRSIAAVSAAIAAAMAASASAAHPLPNGGDAEVEIVVMRRAGTARSQTQSPPFVASPRWPRPSRRPSGGGGSAARHPRRVLPLRAGVHDGSPWHARCAPTDFAGVNMHKRAVTAVTGWLAAALAAGTGGPLAPRVAVLFGPPGAGKLTLLRLAAAAAGVTVVEWTHPPGGHTGTAALSLAEFLLSRACHDVTAPPPRRERQGGGSSSGVANIRRLLFIDDLSYWGTAGTDVARLSASAAADLAGDPPAVVVSYRERDAYLRALDPSRRSAPRRPWPSRPARALVAAGTAL